MFPLYKLVKPDPVFLLLLNIVPAYGAPVNSVYSHNNNPPYPYTCLQLDCGSSVTSFEIAGINLAPTVVRPVESGGPVVNRNPSRIERMKNTGSEPSIPECMMALPLLRVHYIFLKNESNDMKYKLIVISSFRF